MLPSSLYLPLIESSPAPMILVNDSGLLCYMNQAALGLFGYQASDILHKPVEILIPEKHHHAHRHYRNGFQKNPGQRPMGRGRALFAQKKDGTLFPVEVGLNPIHSEGQTYTIASLTDVTVYRNFEDLLEKQLGELEVRNSELNHFTNVVAHDLKEPLRNMIQIANLLHEDILALLEEEHQMMLHHLQGSAERMLSLVTSLLNFSRTGSNQDRMPIALGDILQEVLIDMSEAIRNSNAVVEADPLPNFVGSATEFRQLFQNMISNAIKFHNPERAPYVRIRSQIVGNHIQLLFCDNGIGIPNDKLDAIFNVFHRLHSRSQFEGHGIGLAHCKKIVEAHGGRIKAESTPGLGSTFICILPATVAA